MSRAIVFRDPAAAEFDAAFDWYETQRPGLGVDFIAEVQAALNRILTAPDAPAVVLAVVLADIRRRTVRRFPHSIYYRTHDDRIEVIAVFHGSRDPTVWKDRA